jgi:N utilization substance protein A
VLSNGKRCPNASLPGSRYCGVPAHQALSAEDATADESLQESVAGDDPMAAADETATEERAEIAVAEGSADSLEEESGEDA